MASLSRPTEYGSEQRRGPKIDWLLLLATAILMTVGFMSLYSEGITHDGGANFRAQIRNTVIGLIPFSVFAFVPTRLWYRIANFIYAVNIATLMLVLLHGSHRKGAERWIQLGPIQFQPSEMAKILIVLTLAAFYARRQDSIQKFSTFALSFLHVIVPAGLMLLQPHLGAAIVLMVVWFGISIVAGVPGKFLLGAGLGAMIFGGLVVFVAPRFLHSYQLERIIGISGKDPRGKNWQTDRAMIAFGEGGVSGTGYTKGEQKAGHFIPEQHDDFIFTVVGEEGGLIGCTLVLAAFGFFFYRMWLVMFFASDPYYKMIVAGLLSALSFHMFVNIAMVLHILPVVGLWLPFLSYGGTAMWMCMSCVALVLRIRSQEKPLLF